MRNAPFQNALSIVITPDGIRSPLRQRSMMQDDQQLLQNIAIIRSVFSHGVDMAQQGGGVLGQHRLQ